MKGDKKKIVLELTDVEANGISVLLNGGLIEAYKKKIQRPNVERQQVDEHLKDTKRLVAEVSAKLTNGDADAVFTANEVIFQSFSRGR